MTKFGRLLAEIARRLRYGICGPVRVPAASRDVWYVDRLGQVYRTCFPVLMPPPRAGALQFPGMPRHLALVDHRLKCVG